MQAYRLAPHDRLDTVEAHLDYFAASARTHGAASLGYEEELWGFPIWCLSAGTLHPEPGY